MGALQSLGTHPLLKIQLTKPLILRWSLYRPKLRGRAGHGLFKRCTRSILLSVKNAAMRWLCWPLLQTLKKYIKYLPTSGRIGLHHLIIRPNQKPPDYFFLFQFSFKNKLGISIFFSIFFSAFKLQLFAGIVCDFEHCDCTCLFYDRCIVCHS